MIILMISLGQNNFSYSLTFLLACFASACQVIMRIYSTFEKIDHWPLYRTTVAPKTDRLPKTNVPLRDPLLLKPEPHFLSCWDRESRRSLQIYQYCRLRIPHLVACTCVRRIQMIPFHTALPSPMRYEQILEREYLHIVKQLQEENMGGIYEPAITNVRVWLSLGKKIL